MITTDPQNVRIKEIEDDLRHNSLFKGLMRIHNTTKKERLNTVQENTSVKARVVGVARQIICATVNAEEVTQTSPSSQLNLSSMILSTAWQ